jgi:hypothetical protein
VRSAVAQTITSGVATALTFDTVILDTAGMFSLTNPERLTCQQAGVYLVGVNLRWDLPGAPTGYRSLTLGVSDVGSLNNVQQQAVTAAGGVTSQGAVALHRLAAGVYFSTAVQHTQGANLNVQALAVSSPVFWAVRVA